MHNILSLFNVIAEEAAREGFGINTDIFDTNIINLALLWAVLLSAGSDFLSSTLSDRQQKIVTALQEAEEQLSFSKARLAEAEKQVAQTETSISQIKADAEAAAQTLKESILQAGKSDIESITLKGKSSIAILEANVKTQIQQTIADLALKRVVSKLKQNLTLETQNTFIDKAISQLGGTV
jgi:F-type H+-transporting ATPase subunit b